MLTVNENHEYFEDGKRVPSVTQVCRILAPRFFTDEYSQNKGRIIHLITEYEDQKVLDEESVDPALSGYLDAYRKFKKDTSFKVLETEFKFYAKKYGYAGRVDKYGELFKYRCVLDVKSGTPHEADQYQCPAYLFGLKDNGYKCWRAWDLYLKASGSYSLVEQKKPSILFSKFLEGVEKWNFAQEEETNMSKSVMNQNLAQCVK